MKTPEEIAEATVPWDGAKPTDRYPGDWREVEALVVQGIRADRAQRFNKADVEVLADVVSAGIARELGAIDVRHHYTDADLSSMKNRWEGARAALKAVQEVSR